MLPCKFHQCFGPVNTFTAEECSETKAFGHSTNQILRSQSIPKKLSYEDDPFSKMGKVLCNFKNAINILENGSCFEDNCIRIYC